MSVIPEEARRERGNGDGRAHEDRSPSELQQDIERHRESIDQTLVELESKLSPGQLLDEGLRYVKTGPGEFLGNLGRAAKDNPVPVALASIGLAWLMASQRKGKEPGAGDYSSPVTESRSTSRGGEDIGGLYAQYLAQEYPFEEEEVDCIVYDDLGPDAYSSFKSQSASTGSGGMRDTARQVKESLSGVAGRAGETAGEWSDKARASAAEFQEETRRRLEAIRNRMSGAGDDVKQRIARARELARQRMHSLHSAASSHTRSMARRGGEFVDHYPLSVIAIGLAAGAALGTSLPRTRREDIWMGERSEALKAHAGAAVREQGERVKQAASAAVSAASREAQAQGLSGEGLREQGHRLQEKAEKVMEAARDESQRQGLSEEGLREGVHEAREKIERVGAAARDAAKDPHKPDTPEGA